MVFTAFCGRALLRALCVHCTCAVQNTQFVQFCFWRRGSTFYNSSPCKTHSFLSPIVAHMRSKCCNVASLFLGSSFEDKSVFGLGFWHVQKGICSSLCLHIHKPKIFVLLLCLWAAAVKMKVGLDWGFWQAQKGVCSSLCLHIRKQKSFLDWVGIYAYWGLYIGQLTTGGARATFKVLSLFLTNYIDINCHEHHYYDIHVAINFWSIPIVIFISDQLSIIYLC